MTRQQREWCRLAHQSAEALLDIINDILDLSKIEAGQLVIEHTSFDLHAAIEVVTDLLYVRTKSKGLKLLVSLSGDIPRRVLGDPLRLRQIIINLVGNAIKFTDRGHIVIRVTLKGTDKRALCFEIEDTGIGIHPNKIGYVFKKFSQAEESTTRKYGGTGLGLTICQNLVELMGGKIGLRSEVGKGSVFWFEIPCEADSCEVVEPSQPKLVAEARILVLEQYPPALEIISNYIDNWGLRCDGVLDSKAALTAIAAAHSEKDPYAAILIDADLPHDIWWELVKNMTGLVAARDVLKILCISPNMNWQTYDLLSHGVHAVLKKPVYPSRLCDMLTFLWEHRPKLSEMGVVTYHTLVRSVVQTKNDSGVRANIEEFSGTRVLLVEDQTVNQILMRTILEKVHCVVEVASNGIEAVDMNKNISYDLIFMDCQMPEMDGFEATRTIRALEAGTRRHVPIVALTADAMQGDKDRCLDVGMDDYINKPVKAQKIHEMIAKYGVKKRESQNDNERWSCPFEPGKTYKKDK